MIDKTCRNCAKYPCLRDSALLPRDKCHYPEDFAYEDNLVITQPITLLLKTRRETEEKRAFFLEANKNNPQSIWMDNDEGTTILPETVFKKDWYKVAQQRDKLSGIIAREMYNSLNPEYYDINPKFIQEAGHQAVTELTKKIIGFESEKKEKAEKKDGKNLDEEFDIHQVMQYPDWGLDGKIVNPLVLVKDVRGDRKIFAFKVYVDEDGKLQTERICASLFIPPTGMTPSALEADDVPLSIIYNMLKALMERHLHFTESIEYDLQTVGAMSTYFREVFDTTPYFDYFSAENGVGKTHGMLCLIYASFHGFAMVIPTEAVLFRSVEDAHATVGIDEVHKLFKNPKQHQELLSLLLSGHTKGIMAYRMDMNAKPPRLIPYDPFGLKAFTRKEHVPIDLLSRAITFHMMNARKRKKVEEHLTPEEFAKCRNMMYLYRLKHWQEVKDVYDELRDEKVLEGRQADLFLPLLTIAKLCSDELYSKLLGYAKADETKRFAVKHDERIVVLIEYLKEQGYSGDVKVKEIRDGLEERLRDAGLMKDDKKLTSQTVMNWLNSLGFDKSQKRAQNCAHYIINSKRVDEWYEDIMTEKEENEFLSYPQNLTKLTELNHYDEKKLDDKVNFGKISEVSTNELGKWLINHFRNNRGIPKDFFMRDALKMFPSASPVEIEKFYDLLKRTDYEDIEEDNHGEE